LKDVVAAKKAVRKKRPATKVNTAKKSRAAKA
jgi:hypothetical protein